MTRDHRLSELLLIWEESQEQGRPVGAEELCRDCPELLETLRYQIQTLQALRPVLESTEVGDSSGVIPTPPPTPEQPAPPEPAAESGAPRLPVWASRTASTPW